MTSHGYQLTLVDAAGNDLLELMENDAAYRIDTLGQDATFGNPVPVSEVISSLMTDGGLTTLKSFNNRTAVFTVTITAVDGGSLASGEAELMAALDRVAALCWDVPWASASYFDVVACWSEHAFDDLAEVKQGERRFTLTFECLPFARSDKASTFTWTGPGTLLAPMTSTAGWTVVGGGAITSVAGTPPYLQRTTSGGITLQRTVTLGEYLWLIVGEGPSDGAKLASATVGGTSIASAKWHRQYLGGNLAAYIVPTGGWSGQSAVVEVAISNSSSWIDRAALFAFYSVEYPNLGASSLNTPIGIDVVDVEGTARTPCTISFTAPAGGAFVYTAPDPNAAIREEGAAEAVYAKFTVTDDDGAEITVGSQLMWFPPGDHMTNVGITDSQPLELHPDGVWPTQASGPVDIGGDASGSQWAYPVDEKAAISFFATTGAKNLISASPALPQGYHGDAVTHEQHALHPSRSGFAVLNVNGDPVATTITYYPRWRHHAAQ